MNSAVFSTLTKQQNLFPFLAAVLALGYLAAVSIPLISSSRIDSEHLSSRANTAVSLPDELAQKKRPDFIQISEWHLFGLPVSEISDSNGEPTETQLELKLQGVFFLTQHQKMAHAIIESADQIQKTYKLNDELPGGAILQAIENNKIILLREGKQEYLELDRNKLESEPEPEPEPEPEAATE